MKKIFTLAVFACLLINEKAGAQIVASNDTTICAGQMVQLTVSGGTAYTWSPANTLSSSTSSTPVALPFQTTTYVVSSPIGNANLAPNPTFALGNTGFTSNYTYEVPTNILGSGSYFVGGNANHWNQGMSVLCSDRQTDSDSLMLIANGDTGALSPVWCVTLNVAPNSTYSLSAYFTCFTQTQLPIMQWMVNGTPTGSSVQSVLSCFWSRVTATWSSGPNATTAEFCIYDQNTFGNGNDFALDDISITGSGTWYDTVTITVIPSPTLDLGSDTSLCGSSSILLDARNPGSSYLWNDSSTQQTRLVTTAGTYAVTVSEGNGCSATSDIVVTTSSLTPAVITATDSQICSSDTVEICVNGSFATYQWNIGGTGSCIRTSLAGNYYVTVTDQSGCTAESNRVGVSVFQSPAVSITINRDTLSAFNAVSYQWYFNGSPISGATSNIYVATQSGSYTVQVTDANGCKATSNSISVVTGISDLKDESGIRVYPNPNTDAKWQLEVESEWIDSVAEVLDAQGRVVFKSEIGNLKSEIKPSVDISAGVYWLRIMSLQKSYSRKLIRL